MFVRLRASQILVLACVLAACMQLRAFAQLQVLATRPCAVRGAPLLLPVRVRGVAPTVSVVTIERADGTNHGVAQASLLWPVRVTTAQTGRWAAAANPLLVQMERPLNGSDAFLAIEIPADIPSNARLVLSASTGRTRIEPQWHDRAPDDVLDRLRERASLLVPIGTPDALLSRPDPAMPLERFRYSIGCALRSWEAPPAFVKGSPSDIAARAVTELWKAALARIASSSEGVAVEVAEMLIATCSDDSAPAPIAAWIADPTDISALLALALDRARDDAATVEAVVSWLRGRSPLLVWLEDELVDEIVIAICNPTSNEELVRLQWLVGDDAPLAALVPPAEVARVRILRPQRAAIDGVPIPTDTLDMLHLENRGQVRRFAASNDALPAGVAGVSMANFVPPLDLVAVSTTARQSVAPRTLASLRPRLDGWEIFVEARDAGAVGSGLDAAEVIGPNGATITVHASGLVDDPSAALEGSTGVNFHNYSDRYRFGFAVPPSWLDHSDGRTIVRLAFRRRIGASTFDAPFASVPWRSSARSIGIDILERE